MGTHCSLAQCERNMAKFLCMFALAGLTAGAPSPAAFRVSAGDQEVVVSKIMVSLQPAINDAIAKALAGLSSSSSTSSGSYGVGQSSSSSGYGSSSGYESSSNYGSSIGYGSGSGFGSSQNAVVSSNKKSTTSHFQSAGPGGVVYHDGSASVGGSQQSSQYASGQQSASSGQYSSGSAQSCNAGFGSFSQSSGSSQSSLASQQSLIVKGVMAALVPQIEIAVQNALSKQQQSSAATFSAGGQQTIGVSTQTVSSGSSSYNAAEEQALVSRIIQVLTPSITTSVRNALSARQTVQTQTVQVQSPVSVSQQTSFTQQQSSSSVDTSDLIARITAALRPSIVVSVEDALANRASAQFFNGQSNQGFNSQSSSSSFNANSAGVSSGSLSDIFGNGGVHNVKVQTPEYTIEYNNQ